MAKSWGINNNLLIEAVGSRITRLLGEDRGGGHICMSGFEFFFVNSIRQLGEAPKRGESE